MERSCKSLADGVELAVCRTEQFKTGLLSVTLAVPLAEQTATVNALAPEVLCRGSRRYPDMEQLSAATDRLYGAALGPSVRQRGESQCVSLLCSFIDDRYTLDGTALLEPAAELMGEVLLDPATQDGLFRQDYVESEGVNLADDIRARINDKRGWSIFRLTQEMCAGEAYALDKLGDAEQAAAMTPRRLWDGYQDLLRGARVIVCYGGSADPQRVEEAVERHFGPLLRGREVRLPCQVVERPAGPVRRVTDRLDVTQGKLAMGFRTGGVTMGTPLYPALLVCNALYGGTSHSKLFEHVREKMSLCYFASSMLDGVKGILAVSSGVEFSDFDRAEQAILDQLEAVRRGDFTREELDAALRSVVNSLVSRRDSQGQMEDDWVTRLLSPRGGLDGELLARAVEQVTGDDVAQVARLIQLDTVYRLTGKEGQ